MNGIDKTRLIRCPHCGADYGAPPHDQSETEQVWTCPTCGEWHQDAPASAPVLSGVDIIARAIAARRAASLGLRAYGAEGRTQAEPFTCYASDPRQRDRWRSAMLAKGFTVEDIAP